MGKMPKIDKLSNDELIKLKENIYKEISDRIDKLEADRKKGEAKAIQ